MDKQVVEKIEKLNLDKDIEIILKNNNVNTMQDIWKLKRRELKNIGLKDSQINHIIIKMQLKGLDLNEKMYDKNESKR
jgi:DNA-directed RNA polymerase alpha subunit